MCLAILSKSLLSLGLGFLIWDMRVTREPISGVPHPALNPVMAL